MWAHYADRGQGVCLVIDVSMKISTPVKYLAVRKVYNDRDFPKPNSPNFSEFCSIKSTKWKYEREIRVISKFMDSDVVKDGNMRFLNFSERLKLVGVINGPRPVLCCEEILAAGIDRSRFFQSRPAFRKFNIVSQQNTKLWKWCDKT
nr:DUF2971 domain-containing protein [Ruegeria sp. HKCCD6428]